MPRNIAYCGEDCSSCTAYLATIQNDDNLRQKVIKEWAHIGDFSKYTIECLGCKSDGPILEPCSKCKIKSCCIQIGIEDCSYCTQLEECDQLTKPSRKAIFLRIIEMRNKRNS